MDAHSHVRDKANGHPSIERAALSGVQLLIAEELQPRVELRQIGDIEVKCVAAAAVALQLGLSAPQGKVAQAAALAALVFTKGRTALRRHLLVEELLQYLQLGLEDGVAVNLLCGVVALAELGSQLGHIILQLWAQELELRNILDADVNGVDETAGGGQVRRILHWRERFTCMQRVNKEEVIVRRENLCKLGQVAEITHAPGLVGAH